MQKKQLFFMIFILLSFVSLYSMDKTEEAETFLRPQTPSHPIVVLEYQPDDNCCENETCCSLCEKFSFCLAEPIIACCCCLMLFNDKN